jgi:hypothetical protein
MRVLVNMIDTLGVEATGAALNAVDNVTLLKQKLGQVRAILASDTGDKSYFAIEFNRGKSHAWCSRKST